jgi:hypothetical protein
MTRAAVTKQRRHGSDRLQRGFRTDAPALAASHRADNMPRLALAPVIINRLFSGGAGNVLCGRLRYAASAAVLAGY